MIVDTSALIAIALQEPDFERLELALGRVSSVGIGSPTVVEAGIVLSARLGRDARGSLTRLLEAARIEVLPFGAHHADAALSAWLRFGKGRHPAALNFGDCLSYATATVARRPLLCVGDDFPRTDLALVVLPAG